MVTLQVTELKPSSMVTGLYYLMARYYDASVGRFITRDTFHGFEDDPQSINQYTYTRNNPVIYVDPNGNYYKRFDLGFNGFVSVNVTGSSASILINLTPGMIMNIGIGIAPGGYASRYVVKFLDSWLYPTLAAAVGIWIAKKVTGNLASRAAKMGFGYITGGVNWLSRSFWSGYYVLY